MEMLNLSSTENKPFVICFAGVPGSGKSPIAHYLAVELALTRFERDQIRKEVRDDLWTADINRPDALEEFNKRSDDRQRELIVRNISHVLDSSVDRSWSKTKRMYEDAGFRWFLISLDVSDEYMIRLYDLYGNTRKQALINYSNQHKAFLRDHSKDVNISIKEENYSKRLTLCKSAKLWNFCQKSDIVA